MAKRTGRGWDVSLSWYAYRTLLETVERLARQNATLATKVEELHARRNVSSRLVEVDASALRDERRYPAPSSRGGQAFDASWWPRRSPARKPLRPNPGWTNYSLKGKECALIGCSVAGLSRDVLAKVVAGVERQQRRQSNHIPLFLTDSTDFDLFRARGYVFEYLPGPEKWATYEGSEPWPIYVRRRFELINEKWKFTNTVQFGSGAFPRVGHPIAATSDNMCIIYFPDYSEANPYQMLLYQNVGKKFEVAPGNIDAALATLTRASSRYSVIFHLHWEDRLHLHAPDERAAEQQCNDFVTKLEKFIADGGVFVWTIHNLCPHEQRYADIHDDLCRKLSRSAHRAHVHSRAAIPALEVAHGLDRSKVQVIPHGNYCGVYDGGAPPSESLREQLRIRPDERLFLLFGKIRKYKGAQQLLQAFDELCDRRARLVIAGRQYVPISLEGMTSETARRITIMNRDIPDEDVGRLFGAADFVVLPYEAVLTSGGVLLALSLSRPPIVPDFEPLREVVVDGVNGYLFEPNSLSALVAALRRALNTDSATREGMQRSALMTAMRFDWPTAGEQMRLLYCRARASARDRDLSTLTGADSGIGASPWAVVRSLGRRLRLGSSIRRGANGSQERSPRDEGRAS